MGKQVAASLSPNAKIVSLKFKVRRRCPLDAEIKPLNKGSKDQVHLGPGQTKMLHFSYDQPDKQQ
jgi:hypothetical protein